MNRFRKLVTASVLSMTVLSLTVVVSPVSAAVAVDGDLIKMSGLSTVYYFKTGKRYVFPNEKTFLTWFSDFSKVKTIPQAELESYPLGGNVVYRPGTKLVKITTNPTVYAVEPNGSLRSIVSEANAIALFGANWNKMIDDVPDGFFTNYSTGTALTAGKYPTGQILNPQGSTNLFYYDGTNYRQFSNEAALLANGFNFKYVVTTTTAIVAGGAALAGAEAGLMNAAQAGTTGTTGGVVTGTGSGLTVALAADTPAASTYVRDTGAVVAQSVAPFTKINFTASADGDVVVSTLKLTRSGISADTDLANVYLYDGETRLAEHTSFNSKVITFVNSAGLFTITKGTTKTVTVKADILAANATVSGIVLGVNAATDVTAGTAVVSGSFPINGNSMGVGTVADLGYLNIVATANANFPATIDPGLTNQELWRFNVTANDQQMNLESMKLTLVGTVAIGDVTNFMLKDTAGTQIGSTIASMSTAKEILFNATANPYKITSGQTKTLVVYGDVVNGSNRSFKFTIRKVADVVAKDNGYGIYTAPLVSGSAFVLIDSNAASTGTLINPGTITSGIASDSPSGNIAAGATAVTITKYTLKANGEDVKVNYLRVGSTATEDFKNGKLLWNGSQVGSTDTIVSTTAANVFTVNQVIPAGTTVTVTYQADTTRNSYSDALTGTIVVSLNVSTSGDATGQSSLADVGVTAVTGRNLTLSGGTLAVRVNAAYADMSTASPTGVKGATGVKVGSFVIKAGTGEGSIINQIVVGDDGDNTVEDFGDNFQNLKLMHGSTQLGTTQGTLSGTAGADYTFSLSPALVLAAGEEYQVDAYADILTGAAGFDDGDLGGPHPGLEFVSATGTGSVTSAATTYSSIFNLQNLYIATGGNLVISLGTGPSAAQLIMGSTENSLGAFTFDAGTSPEDIQISRIKIYADSGEAGLSNIKFYDQISQTSITLLGTVAAFASDYAQLDLANVWTIPKGTSKTLLVKADVNTYPNATSAGTVYVRLGQSLTADVVAIGKDTGSVITEQFPVLPSASTMTLVKTKVTVSALAGTTGKSNAQTVGVFRFTNSANLAGQQAKLTDLAVNIATSGIWSTLAASASIKIYRDSVITGNLLGVSATATAPINVALGGWSQNVVNSIGDNNPSTGVGNNNTMKDVSISSGSYVDIYVVADTTGAPSQGTLTVTIPATSGVRWEDGASTGSSAISTIDSLPISAPMMTY